ncbi:MAG: DUF933 domain-containing protein [Candidatus Omnitrophota bacterium]
MKVAVLGIPEFPLGKKVFSDERLEKLKELLHSPKIVYISIDFFDDSKLQESDAIICLEDKKTDLIISDLDFIEKRLNQSSDEKEKQLLSRCQAELEKETLLNELNFTDEEKLILSNLGLPSLKPVSLVPQDKANSHNEIIKNIYELSGYISFFTSNEKELRAWSTKKGTTALDAAGCIHSDIQRGFIKAEIVGYEDIIKHGGLNQAKSQGLMHLEDKEYVVEDGDLIKFRFNV